jgi:hypothetical protein
MCVWGGGEGGGVVTGRPGGGGVEGEYVGDKGGRRRRPRCLKDALTVHLVIES